MLLIRVLNVDNVLFLSFLVPLGPNYESANKTANCIVI